jgi:hypothetical protein
MPPKQKKSNIDVLNASRKQLNDDENDENESLNEEESSIINNQATNLPISAAPAADLLQSQL